VRKRREPIRHIHVYTGDGAGKTTAALGLALRSVGHGHKVIIVQFMKGRKSIGEYKIRRRLYPEYEIHQFGRPEFVNLKNPSKIDVKLAREGLEFAKQALERKPDLLILDEINLAVKLGLLDLSEVLTLLEGVRKGTVIVLTGRGAPQELIERADLATEMRKIKHPLKIGISPCKGIQY